MGKKFLHEESEDNKGKQLSSIDLIEPQEIARIKKVTNTKRKFLLIV